MWWFCCLAPRASTGRPVHDALAAWLNSARRAAITTVLAWLAFAVLSCGVFPARGQPPQDAPLPDEYIVKAADLYAFGLYIDWPKEARDASPGKFAIAILGQDPFAGTLDILAKKKKIQGRTIVIRRYPSLEKYRPGCQIVFVSRSLTPGQQLAAIKKVSGVGVLLVGETPDFAKNGGIINFYLEENRVRFEINIVAARRARLNLDARLINIATPVGAKDQGAGTEERESRVRNRGAG
jgi:hypothetical protein